MAQTITEKIIARHTGKKTVSPGQHLLARVDFMVANDITAPLFINLLSTISAPRLKLKNRIALVPDHFAPNKDIKSAENVKLLRRFSRRFHIKYFFETGRCGIEHCLLPEKGLVLPGELICGADSHTCTYGAVGAVSFGVGSTDIAGALLSGKIWLRVPETIKIVYQGKPKKWVYGKDIILFTLKNLGRTARYRALEFSGETLSHLDMNQRFTICNMAIEAGAKNGIIEPDRITLDYLKNRARRRYKIFKSDPNALYKDIKIYDISNLEPQIALPHSPSNVKSVNEIGKIEVDQVFIGSCTNGWYSDLKTAAEIIKNKKVADSVRLIVGPATPEIYLRCLKDGILETFLNAGAVISPPTCGPCLGGHMGVLASKERAVSTTNRNFIGRMGHPDSEVYLASPAVAAASAIKGRICHPEEVL